MEDKNGFTVLELLVVVAIIGLLTSIVLLAVDQSRQKSRDASRATQMQEFIKAFELFYLENGTYPTDAAADPSPAIVFTEGGLVGDALRTSGYLSRVPNDPTYAAANGYLYCASDDGNSIALLVNTEQDGGGTDYCAASRGPLEYSDSLCSVPEPAGGVAIGLSNITRCSNRF